MKKGRERGRERERERDPRTVGALTCPNTISQMQSHKYGTALSYPNLLQGERYIRMFVADGQGPSISYRKGPMYVSIYVQLFGRGSLNFLAIS